MLGKRDRFTLNSGHKEGTGTSWQCDEPMSQFRTQITLYFPGEPGKYEKFDNVREFTLGSEQRIHFIAENGKNVSTSLPFLLERESRR